MTFGIGYTGSRLLCLKYLSIPNTWRLLVMSLIKRRGVATLEMGIILYKYIDLDRLVRSQRPLSTAKI